MSEVLEYLSEFENGVSEEEICGRFKKLSKTELAAILNGLLQSNQVEIAEENGKVRYRAVRDRTAEYESMILLLLGQIGSTGMWLRDIKTKTNIPHNLMLRIMRNLESSRKIKSVKSVRNNRKMYMLYDVKPAEEVSGGVWFSNNDVDIVFVNKLMDVIHRFCQRPESEYALAKVSSLAVVSEIVEFISDNGVSEVELERGDIMMLIDTLVHDGRMEVIVTERGTSLRALSPEVTRR
ncbi:DNA-directed RNA polymerase III subunit RPC6 [Pancytospora epiphaga]|nr:DNA-directed RNA polymerase III subunit RPC6 [Pancytospora epiphaga]